MARDDRARDEFDLALVRARAAGESLTVLAARLRISRGSISTTTTRIRAADIAESGEPPAVVAASYWSA